MAVPLSCLAAEHYADDLEVDLEEIMTSEFNVELEDESPRLVAKELVQFHSDLLQGDLSRFHLLQQANAQAGAAASRQQTVRKGFLGPPTRKPCSEA